MVVYDTFVMCLTDNILLESYMHINSNPMLLLACVYLCIFVLLGVQRCHLLLGKQRGI